MKEILDYLYKRIESLSITFNNCSTEEERSVIIARTEEINGLLDLVVKVIKNKNKEIMQER